MPLSVEVNKIQTGDEISITRKWKGGHPLVETVHGVVVCTDPNSIALHCLNSVRRYVSKKASDEEELIIIILTRQKYLTTSIDEILSNARILSACGASEKSIAVKQKKSSGQPEVEYIGRLVMAGKDPTGGSFVKIDSRTAPPIYESKIVSIHYLSRVFVSDPHDL